MFEEGAMQCHTGPVESDRFLMKNVHPETSQIPPLFRGVLVDDRRGQKVIYDELACG